MTKSGEQTKRPSVEETQKRWERFVKKRNRKLMRGRSSCSTRHW